MEKEREMYYITITLNSNHFFFYKPNYNGSSWFDAFNEWEQENAEFVSGRKT